jgi:AraC-like DNA-binding protein
MDKLDIILQKLEAIEKHLNIQSKTIYDDMAEAYSIKDTAKILGCSETKVRQYIKYEMLDSFKIGHKRMIKSKAIKRLIKQNSK